VNYAYNVGISIYTPHNAWKMYIKVYCVLKQIIVIYFGYLMTNYIAIFEIIKSLCFLLWYKALLHQFTGRVTHSFHVAY